MLTLRGDTDQITGKADSAGNELEISGFYGDHAVFQHGKSFIIRGKAQVQVKVELFIAGVHLAVFANDYGEFSFRVPPLAPARNLELTVIAGGSKIVFHDIAIGNVYIAGGQSNMEFAMKNAIPPVELLDGCDLSGIRCFALPVKTNLGIAGAVDGAWQCASKDQLAGFSALAGFFAVELFKRTNIPVGIVTASFGGVNIESFISEYSLLSSKFYHDEVAAYEVNAAMADLGCKTFPALNEKLEDAIMAMFPEIPEDGGIGKGFCAADFDDSNWDEMLLPDSWTQAGHNHAGIFYFRRKIVLPAGCEKEKFTIHLGAVDKADKSFVNGIQIGATGDCRKFDNWNKLRVYEVPAGIFHEGENVIAIQASSMVSICSDGGMLGPAEEMYLESAAMRMPLNGKWKMIETFDAGIEGMSCMRKFGQGGVNSFHVLFDNMIAPIYGTAFAGALWYQGEANAICMGHTYQELLSLLIADWRRNFLDPELHFYIVQLPEFQNPHTFAPFATWPLIREAQQLAAAENSCTAVVTVGTGDVLDIHPKSKYPIACRIADMEYVRLQGRTEKMVQLSAVTSENGSLILKFDGALKLDNDIKGLVVAGKDMIAHAADCRTLDEYTLQVSSTQVAEPFAVWYAWAENPRYHDLKSADMQEISPFRAALDGSRPAGKNLID